MDFRQRMIRTVRFEAADALPFRHAYGLMPGVLDDWHAEGLPRSVRTEDDVYGYFGFPTRSLPLPIDVLFDPPFETRVLREDADEVVAIDYMGRATRLLKRYASLPLPLGYPVADRATWEGYRRRLAYSPDRIGADLERIAAENLATGRLNVFGTMGFYWFPRDLMGDEGLCVAYYEQPDLVEDILETWCGLIERALADALARVRLDAIHFGEDMAYRNASMIGPKLFDRFIRPYYERIRRIVHRHQVPIFGVDTDGSLAELASWFAACGVNLIGPCEVQAGNDVTALRRRFGRAMAYDGGLDKRVLTEGREAIDAMLDRTIPFIKGTGGGWCVSLDHRVIRGTPLADFQHYVDRAREMIAF